jgi:hypothetical protein
MENEQPDNIRTKLYLGATRREWLRGRADQRFDRSMSAVVRELIDRELAAELEAKELERLNARTCAMEALIHQLDATNAALKQELDAEKSKERARALTWQEKATARRIARYGEDCIKQVKAWQLAGHTPDQVLELCKAQDIRTPEGRKPHQSTILKWMRVDYGD